MIFILSGIKKQREIAGFTQVQVAEAMKTTQSAVAMWESGKYAPRADALPALAKLFGCSIDDLYAAEEDKAS